MIPRIWLINIILALCALFAGSMAYRVWVQEEPSGRGAPPPSAPSVSAPERRQANKGTFLRESAYKVITERSLFSPDRKESLPEDPIAKTEEEQILISGKKINLHGVIGVGDELKALIDNPLRGPDEPPMKWVRIGDAFSDLSVAAIESESILLKQGEKEYKIPLFTDEKKEPRSSQQGMDSSLSTPTVVNTEIKKPSSQAKVASDSNTKPVARPQTVKKKENDATGEFETIETPFGTIKRKKRSE
jgi:hypothetical protein